MLILKSSDKRRLYLCHCYLLWHLLPKNTEKNQKTANDTLDSMTPTIDNIAAVEIEIALHIVTQMLVAKGMK